MSKYLVTSAVGDHATAWGTTDWSAAGTGSPHWTTATTGIMNGLANLGMAFSHVYGQISGKPPVNQYAKDDDYKPEREKDKNNTILYLGIALVAIVLFLVFRKK